MIFAEKLLYLRKNNNMSQEELSEKLNVSRQAVSRWESGTALPDATNLLCISKLFNVSIDYLLYDEHMDTYAPLSNTTTNNSNFNDKLKKLKPKYFVLTWVIGYIITYVIYNKAFYFGTYKFSLALALPLALLFSKIYLWFVVIFAVIYFICYNSHKK